MLIPTAITVVGAAVVRTVCGWAENALKDYKPEMGIKFWKAISPFEWSQLGATIFRVGVIGLAAAYGFNLAPLEAGGSAIVADFVLKAIAKLKR